MFVNVGHGRLHAREINCIPPWVERPQTIIFLNGVAIDHTIWVRWIPLLCAQFRLVFIDTRGFGLSSEVGSVDEWTLDDLSGDISAVASALGVDEYHAIGESFGGTAVLNLAANGDNRLRSITCVSGPHKGGGIEKVKKWRQDVQRLGIDGWSEEMMSRRFVPGFVPQSHWDAFKKIQDDTRADALLKLGDLLLQTDLTNRLSSIGVPALIIAPDSSPFVGVDIPCELHTLLPRSELTIIPASRHGIPFSHPIECTRFFLGFMERNGFI